MWFFVTGNIEGHLYSALNANGLSNPFGFAAPVTMDFSGQSAAQKKQRWQQNWRDTVMIETTLID